MRQTADQLRTGRVESEPLTVGHGVEPRLGAACFAHVAICPAAWSRL